MDSNIVKTAGEIETIVATISHDFEKTSALEKAGVKVINVPEKDGHISLENLMTILGKMKIDSVLIEAGAKINASAFSEGIVDCYQVYIAPKIIGGSGAKSAVGGKGIPRLADAIRLSEPKIKFFDGDIMLEYRVI